MKAASATSVIERFADEYMKGPDADPLHLLQPGGEVHRSARPRPRSRRRLPRHRPLCPPGRRRRTAPELHRAADPARDQSYFLFATTREQLDLSALPARRHAQAGGARDRPRARPVVADKPDSQDICFVPNGDYASVVKKVRPEAARRGRDRRPRRPGARPASRPHPFHRRPAPRPRDRRPGRAALRRPARARERAGRGRAEGALAVRAARLSGLNWLGEEPERRASAAKVRSMARPAPARFDGECVISTRRNMESRPARRRCSTTATGCSAAAGSRKRSPAELCRGLGVRTYRGPWLRRSAPAK